MSRRSISTSIRMLLLSVMLAFLPAGARAQQDIGADVSIDTNNGYARIVFLFSEPTDADVRLSNGILIVTFKDAVDVGVDQLANGNDYVSAARRDPDGKGIRLALARKVRLNSMAAGERLFVDLLPDSWTAAPPPLPREVVEDLARRTREAEKRVQSQVAAKPKPQMLSRVRVSALPTFTRYVFELPEFVAITTDRTKDKLRLVFDSPVKFDLGDAKAALPPTVSTIDSKTSEATASVAMAFVGRVDVRSFREDNNFVVDVVSSDAVREDESRLPPMIAPPADVPADGKRSDNGATLPATSKRSEAVIPAKDEQPKANPKANMAHTEAARADAAMPEAVAAEAAKLAIIKPDTTKPAVVPLAPVASRSAAVMAAVAAPKPAAGAEEKKEPATSPPQPAGNAGSGNAVAMTRRGEIGYLTFPFSAPTPAAAFVRADMVWLVFDTGAPVVLTPISNDIVREASVVRQNDIQIVRMRLERPRLVSLSAEDNNWTVAIGDTITNPSLPVGVMRNVVNEKRASANIPFDDPRALHRIEDPEVGDTLLVVTGLGPARGIPKPQDFVDFRALASVQGIAIQPQADDLNVELSADRILIARPSGLTLTSSSSNGQRGGLLRPMMFDSQQWGFDRQSPFLARQENLIDAAAKVPEAKRNAARLELARFYFARDMYAEAKGVLDVAIAEDNPSSEDASSLVMRGVANLLMGRNAEGLKDINNQIVGAQNDAPLWRAFAAAKQGKWPDARDGFRKSEVAIGMLPLELQREINREAVRAAIEVGDFGGAAGKLNEFETLSVPDEMKPSLSVLAGRIHEGLGRNVEAIAAYRAAADSADRSSAAQGRLREISLRYRLGDLKRPDVINELEALTAAWRGDQTEVEALQLLGRLYTEEARYRDAFNAMRTAFNVMPDSDVTRSIQDDAAATFSAIFLGSKGDTLPPIEALSLFYDFRDLTPIGRKGDEMIRRLADRLVAVDLLDQAAELLQHQIDHRLQGAARAQVATRLAVIYLMSRKPDRALSVLRSTRTGELSAELRNQRLLIEARAMADTGRYSLGLEVIENVDTPDAARTRSDLMWNAKQYRQAAEQIEMLYGDRWRDFTPFNEIERRDILRAAMGYNMAEDKLGLDRFKEKFAAGMMQGPDRRAFEVVTSPLNESSDEFNKVARVVASLDTLGQFLRDIRSNGAESSSAAGGPAGKPNTQTRLSQPDYMPTGAVKADGPVAVTN